MTTVKLTGNFLATARCLIFSDASGISWAFDQNTNTLTASGTSGGGALINSTEVADSIEWNGSALQLVGDAATPGNTMLYGTNSSGVKGWYTQPGGGGGSGANPTASVGLTAVNGTATTFLRSDGAPALSQSIVPTWTGVHTFSQEAVLNAGALLANAEPVQWKDSLGGTRTVLQLFSDNNVYFDNPVSGGAINIRPNATGETWTFLSGLISSGVTGGAKGAGSINADGGYFYKGNSLNQVATAQSANTIFAGPSSGSAAQPGFRALVAADGPVVGFGSSITTLTQAGGASQTYTVPAGATTIEVICIGGGAGGGSGCRVLAPTNTASGGTGGGGGSISVNTLRAADLGSSVTVTFSNPTTGGNGGAASSATGSGNNGVDGSNVAFGNFCSAAGGHHGSGGTQGGTTGGAAAQTLQANFAIGTASPNQSTNAVGQPGGNPSSNFVNATSTASTYSACAGGNGAGLSTTTPAAFAGGAGGGTTFAGGYATQLPGGAGGAIASNGSPGTSGSGTQGGAGGGGGGSSIAGTVGGNGGTGGNYGGGGGGGGSCNTVPTLSSSGGNGAPAMCIVIAW